MISSGGRSSEDRRILLRRIITEPGRQLFAGAMTRDPNRCSFRGAHGLSGGLNRRSKMTEEHP